MYKKRKLIAEHILETGTFKFYDDIFMGEINEGVHITFNNSILPLQICEQIYGDKPFVYISNRVNSYSVDPIGFYEAVQIFPNVKGFAIVTQDRLRQTLASLEKNFNQKPNDIFLNIDDAFNWAIHLLEDEQAHQKKSTI